MKKAVPAIFALASAVGVFALAEAKASKGNLTEEPDYLLILGNTVHGEEPSEILKSRITAAAEYLKAHPSVKAIPCGGIVQKDQTKAEAEVTKDALIAFGIEPERIILEDKSKTTVQNFRNAKKILEENGDGSAKLAFVSSEHHLLRSSLIAKRAGMPMPCIPAKTPKKDFVKSYIREFFVFSSILRNS